MAADALSRLFRYEDLYDSATIFPDEEKYFGSIQEEDIALLRRRVSLAMEKIEEQVTDQDIIAHVTRLQRKMYEDTELRGVDSEDEITPTIMTNNAHCTLEECEIEKEGAPLIVNVTAVWDKWEADYEAQRWKVQEDAAYISGNGTTSCSVCADSEGAPMYLLEEDIVGEDIECTLLSNVGKIRKEIPAFDMQLRRPRRAEPDQDQPLVPPVDGQPIDGPQPGVQVPLAVFNSRRLKHLEEADTEQGEEAGREEMKEEYIKEEKAEKDEEQAGMKREEEELEQQGSRELKWHLHLSEKD